MRFVFLLEFLDEFAVFVFHTATSHISFSMYSSNNIVDWSTSTAKLL